MKKRIKQALLLRTYFNWTPITNFTNLFTLSNCKDNDLQLAVIAFFYFSFFHFSLKTNGGTSSYATFPCSSLPIMWNQWSTNCFNDSSLWMFYQMHQTTYIWKFISNVSIIYLNILLDFCQPNQISHQLSFMYTHLTRLLKLAMTLQLKFTRKSSIIHENVHYLTT